MDGKERPPLDRYKAINAALLAGLPEKSVTATDKGDLRIETTGLLPRVKQAIRNYLELLGQDRQGVEETEE